MDKTPVNLENILTEQLEDELRRRRVHRFKSVTIETPKDGSFSLSIENNNAYIAKDNNKYHVDNESVKQLKLLLELLE
jgi:hypothetical protein